MNTNQPNRTALAIATGAIIIAVLAAPTANAALIHHWELNGDATDSTGSHNGTLNGDVGFVAGQFGQAATFDGTGDFISTSASSLPSTDFTLTAWVFATNALDINYVAGTQSSGSLGAFLRVTDGAAFARLLPGAAVATGGAVPTSDWTHLAVTVSSVDGLTVYVDGSPVAADATGTGHTPFSNFKIGARPDGNTFGFDGLIDDVAVWDEVLSSSQLNSVINFGAQNFNVVPEPQTIALTAFGILGIVGLIRRRSRR